MNKVRTASLQIQKWDEELRAGRQIVVRTQLLKALSGLDRSQLSETESLELSRIARRCSESEKALSLLSNRALELGEPNVHASVSLRTEYAANLISLGLLNEAARWLQGLSAAYPPAMLIQSFLHFAKWEHPLATPILENYLKHLDAGSYDWAVGKINWLASLTNDRQVIESSAEILSILERRGAQLLIANCLEITAQALIRTGRYAQAKRAIERSAQIQGSASRRETSYLKKWQTIFAIKQGKFSGRELLQRKADFDDPEVWRDLDRHFALKNENSHLMRYLWFGTENENYRRRFLSDIPLAGPQLYRWWIPRDPRSPILRAPSENVRNLMTQEIFTSPSLVARLWNQLTRDFYKRKSLAEIYDSIYDAPFIPTYSNRAVLQLVKRLNRHLRENKIGLRVVSESRCFRLTLAQPEGPNISILDLEPTLMNPHGIQQAQEQRIISFLASNRILSPRFLAEKLGLKERRIQGLLLALIRQGKIRKLQKGQYSLVR